MKLMATGFGVGEEPLGAVGYNCSHAAGQGATRFNLGARAASSASVGASARSAAVSTPREVAPVMLCQSPTLFRVECRAGLPVEEGRVRLHVGVSPSRAE